MTFERLYHTVRLLFCSSALGRGNYLRSKAVFGAIGKNFRFMPRVVPLYPELIHIHDNVFITSDVHLITHDAVNTVLNHCQCLPGGDKFPELIGCIEIMDNVFVGANSIVLPNVKIGPNVIIGAGSLITKDCEPDSVYAGVPAKRVGSFADFVRRRMEGGYAYTEHNQHLTEEEVRRAWELFESAHRK